MRSVLGLRTPAATYSAVASTDAASFATLPDSGGAAIAVAPYAAAKTGWWGGLSGPAKGGVVAAIVATLALGLGLGLGLRKAPPASVCAWSAYRLPANAIPLSYAVRWTPTATAGAFVAPLTFSGSSVVDVRIASDSPCILVHAYATLALASVTAQAVAASGAAVGTPANVTYTVDAVNERVVLAMPFSPAVGSTVRLAFAFTAPLATNNVGLYVSTYVNDYNVTVTALATQFEATFARRAFPCFDEPGYKANFSLTVDGVPAAYTALGNMPIAADTVRTDGARTVTFGTTPRMSTYLLAFVCGPLVSVTIPNVGSGGIPVTAWAVDRNNNTLAVGYAAAAAAVIVPFYENLSR